MLQPLRFLRRLAPLPVLGALCLLLTGCLPAARGPQPQQLILVPDEAPWTPRDLIEHSRVPRGRVLPLAEAIERATLWSVIVGCQRSGAVWGHCTHLTRKVAPDQLSEETGALGTGARLRPIGSLLERDLILVIDTGVRERHLPALKAEMARLRGAPYLLGGQLNAFDCVTYQNALQRAAGLPDAAAFDPQWRTFLPIGTLSAPANRLVWVGVGDRVSLTAAP